MEYNDLLTLSLDELRLFRQKALNELFKLQSSGDEDKIKYWSDLEAMSLKLIQSKHNG